MEFRSIVKRVEKVDASLNTLNMEKACNEGLQLLIVSMEQNWLFNNLAFRYIQFYLRSLGSDIQASVILLALSLLHTHTHTYCRGVKARGAACQCDWLLSLFHTLPAILISR